jgi:hypothetical protein
MHNLRYALEVRTLNFAKLPNAGGPQKRILSPFWSFAGHAEEGWVRVTRFSEPKPDGGNTDPHN